MLRFGLFGRIWVRIGPKGDKALRMGRGEWTDRWTDGRMDGWTDSPCVLQDFVPFGGGAQKKKARKKQRKKKKRISDKQEQKQK